MNFDLKRAATSELGNLVYDQVQMKPQNYSTYLMKAALFALTDSAMVSPYITGVLPKNAVVGDFAKKMVTEVGYDVILGSGIIGWDYALLDSAVGAATLLMARSWGFN